MSKAEKTQKMVEESWQDRVLYNEILPKPGISAHPSGTAPAKSVRFSILAAQIHSEALRKALGLEGDGTLQERLKNLYLVKKPLDPFDQQQLYGFLASSAKIEGLTDPATHALKDGIMVFLASDASTLNQTVEILRQMYLDPGQDPVVRSYAMQYLTSSLPEISDDNQEADIQQLVENAASNPTQVGSGAALLGLEPLANNGSVSLTKVQISQMALATVSNTTIPEMKRIHPLLVCGELNVEEAAPVARDLAVNGNQAMVRMAALATLGQVGQVADMPLLTTASNDPDERIRNAASSALSVLRSRLKQ